jgi:RNA polymerase sigma-70 factor (ECF subfamily)
MSEHSSTQPTELTTLLERAIAGDPAAFEQIVIRNERRVLTVAWRLLGNMDDAQDAAQEVFLRAFKYLHRFDARKSVEPWLIRMTVNVCRSFGRKKKSGEKVFSKIDCPLPVAESEGRADPHSQLAADQQRRMLHRALADLPEKEKAAIILRDIEGFSTAEVAEILGSSKATVRVQISSARMKIRKVIARMKEGRP